MKLLVPLKRVPDYETKLRIDDSGTNIVTQGIKWIVNPFDEIAVEEALRLKEAGKVTEVEVVTIGPDDAVSQLRYALAMGADTGIHVVHDGPLDSDLVSRVLAALWKRQSYGFVIMGKQAVDSDRNQSAQLLAGRLGIGQACFASKVELQGEGSACKALVTREVDGGLETIELALPCVISTDLRLNEPRYASLPGIMKAKKKPVETVTLADLQVDPEIKVRVLRLSTPPKKSAGRKVASVAELVTALKDEAKVL